MNALEHTTAIWRQAAHDLGLKLIAPFKLADEDRTLSYPGLIPPFGSPMGMLVIVGLHYDDHVRVAQQQGYGYSCFSEDSQSYDRDSFIDVLNDWGWSDSPNSVPAWYTGEPWTS